MKKTLSLFLSVLMLLTMLIVPVNLVSAATDEYLDHYAFSFAEEDVYAYQALVWGSESAGTLSFTPASGVGTSSVAPLYSISNYVNRWNAPTAVHSTVEANGASYDALSVSGGNDIVFVPIMDNGKPFELAPGHTYTVKMSYTHNDTNSTGDSWYANRGLYAATGLMDVDGEYKAFYSRDFASIPFGSGIASRPVTQKIDDLYTVNTDGIVEKTFTITAPAAEGEGYTYDADKNAYTATTEVLKSTSVYNGTYESTVGDTASVDYYNYLYFYFNHYGTYGINITQLEIFRDDYVPDWDKELEDKYVFDFSDYGNYADVPNKEGQTTIDSTKTWTYAPVSIDPGLGRTARNVYPVYSNCSTAGWGPQTWLMPTTVTVDESEVNAVKIQNTNPSYFVPLKADGTPFELAPGHTYTVKASMCIRAYTAGSQPMVQCDIGVPSDGTFVLDSQSSLNLTAVKSQRFAWLSNTTDTVKEFTFTITAEPQSDRASVCTYNETDNTYSYTYTYNNVEYAKTLYNYLYFSFTPNTKPTIDFISLEITRDDYVPQGTVEYIDDGNVLKSEEVNVGDYAINYIPDNTATEYFQGWYLDEALTEKVASSTVPVTEGGLKLYAKWEEYKDSVTSTNPTYYYGTAYAPYFYKNASTGVTEYSTKISTQSHVASQTTYTKVDSVAKFTTTFWGDGILLTAADDTTGELFRAAPNTTYKISLKFRITAETTREDGVDVAVSPGAGLPNTNANYPMGKYYDENTLKAHGDYTRYTDGVTAEGEYVTYTAVYTTGEFTTIPAIGVELWIYNGAAVEVSELSVERITGVDLSGKQFNVSTSAANNTSYKINFDYILKEAITEDISVGFKTTAADGIGYPSYIGGMNNPVYTISASKAAATVHTATVLLTTDMYASAVDGEGCNDTLTALNTSLYGYLIGTVDTDNLIITNVSITGLTDTAGNDLIGVVGGQYLNSESEAAAGCQAIRYSFTYDSRTGSEIYINGTAYTVKERGFIYANGNNYLGDTENSLYTGDMNVNSATGSKYLLRNKTTNLSQCWSVTDVEGTDYYNIAFSTYVTNFDVDDTRELMVKAYVVVEVDGQQFTLYSGSINRSIAYMKAANEETINPNVRQLVWGYDFSKVNDISEVTYFHQNFNQNSFNTQEGDTRNAVVGGKNLVIEDGALVMKITNSEVDGKIYDMPMTLSTRDKMSFKYGYLEIEAEIPFEYGVHAGFWTVPQNSLVNAGAYEKVNSEIDIFETNGRYNALSPNDKTAEYANPVSNLHKWYHYYGDDGSMKTGTCNIGAAKYSDTVTFTDGLFGSDYDISDTSYVMSLEEGRKVHKYGMEWNPEYIAFYIDGVEYFRTYISEGNDFYNPAEGHENTVGMDCFHEEQNILFSFCPRWNGYAWAYGGDLNNADYYDSLYENGILAVSTQGGDSIDFKIHSIKLYQRDGETLTVK